MEEINCPSPPCGLEVINCPSPLRLGTDDTSTSDNFRVSLRSCHCPREQALQRCCRSPVKLHDTRKGRAQECGRQLPIYTYSRHATQAQRHTHARERANTHTHTHTHTQHTHTRMAFEFIKIFVSDLYIFHQSYQSCSTLKRIVELRAAEVEWPTSSGACMLPSDLTRALSSRCSWWAEAASRICPDPAFSASPDPWLRRPTTFSRFRPACASKSQSDVVCFGEKIGGARLKREGFRTLPSPALEPRVELRMLAGQEGPATSHRGLPQ